MFKLKFLLSNLFNKSRTNLIVKEFSLKRNFFYSWGMKKSGKFIRNNRKKFKVVLIEDGFIHSFGYKKQKIPLSICYDNKGIYYNFESKSDLFEILKNDISEENYLRAKNIIKLWKKCSISKYNFPY